MRKQKATGTTWAATVLHWQPNFKTSKQRWPWVLTALLTSTSMETSNIKQFLSGDKSCSGWAWWLMSYLEKKIKAIRCVFLQRKNFFIDSYFHWFGFFFSGGWILHRKNPQHRSPKPPKQNVQSQKHVGHNQGVYGLSECRSHERNRSPSPTYIFIAQVQTASGLLGAG